MNTENIIIGTVRYRKSQFKPKEPTTYFMATVENHRNHIYKFEEITKDEGLIVGSDPYNGARICFFEKEIVGAFLVIEDGDKVYPIHFNDYSKVRHNQTWAGRVISKPSRARVKDRVTMKTSGDAGSIMLINDNVYTILLDNGSTTEIGRTRFILKSRNGKPTKDMAVIFEPSNQV